jgi:hypothetical protein
MSSNEHEGLFGEIPIGDKPSTEILKQTSISSTGHFEEAQWHSVHFKR